MKWERERRGPEVTGTTGNVTLVSRRSALGTLGRLSLGAAAGAVAVERFTDVDLIPEIPFFKFKTKEEVIEAVRTGLHRAAKYVPVEVTHDIEAKIEKDAPFFDGVFDKESRIKCKTKMWVTCDLSPFLPPEKPTPTPLSPVMETTTTLPHVPMIGGRPAIEVSDDATQVLVRLAHPVIPPKGDIVPDIENLVITHGKGGAGDRLQNLFGIHKISEKDLIKLAQKYAWELAIKDPEIIPSAEQETRELIEWLFGWGFPGGVRVEFVDPNAPPPRDQKIQLGSARPRMTEDQ